jgi:predicted HicB family RNase H-like nuclease
MQDYFVASRRSIMTKTETTKILLALPEELKRELQKEADKQYRSLNNYILWLLVNRHENKPGFLNVTQ